jgi:hypothetical protein
MKITKFFAVTILTIGFVSPAILPAVADKKFENFKKNQLSQFDGDFRPEKCKEKIKKQGGLTYYFCQHQGKPVYIRVHDDDNPISFYEFKNSRLVQSCGIDSFTCTGYKNNRLVAMWNFENETVDFNVSSPDKRDTEKAGLAEARKALKLFGFTLR